MLKLELSSDGERTTLRLIGRVQSAHLSEITEQMGNRRSAKWILREGERT